MMTDSSLSNTETWTLLVLFGVSVAVIAITLQGDGEPLVASLAFSGLAFSITYSLIVWLRNTFLQANLRDPVRKLWEASALLATCYSWFSSCHFCFTQILSWQQPISIRLTSKATRSTQAGSCTASLLERYRLLVFHSNVRATVDIDIRAAGNIPVRHVISRPGGHSR